MPCIEPGASDPYLYKKEKGSVGCRAGRTGSALWRMSTKFNILDSQWVALPIAILFIQSLLIWWFLTLIMDSYDVSTMVRLLRGLAILFVVFIPVFLVIEGFQNTKPTAGFFIPLFLYALTIPLFDSFLTHINLLADPSVLVPQAIGGIGFGIVGVGSYFLKRSVLACFVCATVGITLVFLSAPDIFQTFLYVLSGGTGLFG